MAFNQQTILELERFRKPTFCTSLRAKSLPSVLVRTIACQEFLTSDLLESPLQPQGIYGELFLSVLL